MPFATVWATAPKRNAHPDRLCRVCGNGHAIIRKYNLNICRQCFREKAVSIGFQKLR